MIGVGIDPVAALLSGIQALNNIREHRRAQAAMTAELLEEINTNLIILRDDYLRSGAPIHLIIKEIKVDYLEVARRASLRRNYNFTTLNKGPIDPSCFITAFQEKHYANYDVDKILFKISEKVIEFKRKKRLYCRLGKWSKKVNPEKRMDFIFDLYLLLSNHLSF
jgi:hypothetical protein